ncbi:MAG: hypothetical protein H6907_13625 [Hyphomicrobiales bacterium]|nr:hypothetical protein [Hyphomicrobiales bacterium]
MSDSETDDIAAIRALLVQVEAVAGELLPNESALYEELRAKYAGDGAVGFADRRCLEVILRNVLIRKQ